MSKFVYMNGCRKDRVHYKYRVKKGDSMSIISWPLVERRVSYKLYREQE